MKDNKIYAYISEQTSYPEDYDMRYKIHNNKELGILYVTFKAVLQSFDVMNRNKRMYHIENVFKHFSTDERLKELLRMNKLTSELGHPIPSKTNEQFSLNRLMEVPKNRSAAIIKRPRIEGNLLVADIQTDPGTQDFGVNIAKNIISSGYIPAFSLRSFGELQNENGKPYVDVKTLITYDMVEYPSHKEAYADIVPVYNESVNSNQYDTIVYFADLAKYAYDQTQQNILCESFGISKDDFIGVTSSGNNIVAKQNKNLYFVNTTKINFEIRDYLKQLKKR